MELIHIETSTLIKYGTITNGFKQHNQKNPITDCLKQKNV